MAIINNTWNIEHFQLKYYNAADWRADYVLSAGEVGLELDTRKYKLGDGVKKWSELDYYTNPIIDNLISALTDRMTAAEGKITTLEGKVSTAEEEISTLKSKVAAIEGITTISVNSPATGE